MFPSLFVQDPAASVLLREKGVTSPEAITTLIKAQDRKIQELMKQNQALLLVQEETRRALKNQSNAQGGLEWQIVKGWQSSQ